MRTRYRYGRGLEDSAPQKVIYLSVVIKHNKKLQLWSLCENSHLKSNEENND